jgi:hypothetical protein
VALFEHGLSTRMEAHGRVDFDTMSGAARVEVPGSKGQTGVALGPRTNLGRHGSGISSSAARAAARLQRA